MFISCSKDDDTEKKDSPTPPQEVVDEPQGLSGKTFSSEHFSSWEKEFLPTDNTLLTQFKSLSIGLNIEKIENYDKDTTMTRVPLGSISTPKLIFIDDKNCTFQTPSKTKYANVHATKHFYSCHFEEAYGAKLIYDGHYEELQPSFYINNGRTFTLTSPWYFIQTYYTDIIYDTQWEEENKEISHVLNLTYTIANNVITFRDKDSGQTYVGEITDNVIKIDFKIAKNGYLLIQNS